MMNATIEKFGFPETLIREYAHWVILLRPSQITLGSLVIAAKSDAGDFGDLSPEHFAELKHVTNDVSTVLQRLVSHQKLNWLMLMMVDPHVHFHLIPRYEDSREFDGQGYSDNAWPGPPDLSKAIKLSSDQIIAMRDWLKTGFSA